MLQIQKGEFPKWNTKNFQTLNDFDKYTEPQDYALDYLKNTALTKYIKRKKRGKKPSRAQDHNKN